MSHPAADEPHVFTWLRIFCQLQRVQKHSFEVLGSRKYPIRSQRLTTAISRRRAWRGRCLSCCPPFPRSPRRCCFGCYCFGRCCCSGRYCFGCCCSDRYCFGCCCFDRRCSGCCCSGRCYSAGYCCSDRWCYRCCRWFREAHHSEPNSAPSRRGGRGRWRPGGGLAARSGPSHRPSEFAPRPKWRLGLQCRTGGLLPPPPGGSGAGNPGLLQRLRDVFAQIGIGCDQRIEVSARKQIHSQLLERVGRQRQHLEIRGHCGGHYLHRGCRGGYAAIVQGDGH